MVSEENTDINQTMDLIEILEEKYNSLKREEEAIQNEINELQGKIQK